MQKRRQPVPATSERKPPAVPIMQNSETSNASPLKVDPAVFREDPHAAFAQLRPRSPVLDIGTGVPIVTRHADVEAMITDPRTRQIEKEAIELRGITSGALHTFYANSMLVSNDPAHTNRRRPVARTFAFKLINDLRPRIRALAEEVIDKHVAAGEMDFMQAVASPLPSRIIAEILGIARQEAPRFAQMVYGMSRGISSFRPEHFEAIEAAAADLNAYTQELIDVRRARPEDDFLSDYVRAVDEAGVLTEAETLIQIVSLILAGSDTTRFGLTALVWLLLDHRDQWDAVCADPELAAGAVLEALRYEPPVGTLARVTTEPLDIGGVALKRGTVLSLSILSAQRDEQVYRDPQRFDIARTDHPRWSVTFGGGPHRCLGEALARAEMEETLVALTRRLPDLRRTGNPPVTKAHFGIRSISSMTLGWH